ncbi:proteasome adapter and scaffold protein ECM29 [Belonocnema kinseyi]|uniref:proteasome adapter and scaffold protein ECM29 n=1 Tax=Belonocnema kinseyi TaxID=2817044 RepID=UPI00143D6C19|nr:proteasome adapter and scaffold protein ECM29 [Belonocnema kinseyi]
MSPVSHTNTYSSKMAAATDELILLERVFLRLGSAETDEQLQASVCKFLPPVLLKLSSTQEGVRKKVMELLIHINKRVRSRPQVQLPVEALLLQYQDPVASSFVINFTIIYIKLGYPRMDINKQAELVPCILNAIEGKPLSHQDSLLLIIMPALAHIKVPMDPDKRRAFLGLQDKPNVAKQLINFMLDMLLLPYGAVGNVENQQSGQPIDWSKFQVPPGLSTYAFKRVIGETPPTAEQLEQTKLGILKFICAGVFSDSDILIHLIVAAADTRFSVANLADLELKKIIGALDWSSMQLAAPLYSLFLGTEGLATQEVKEEMKRLPASTRIRLKLLYYLCRVTKAGFIIPPCIQVVFDSLYGSNTNPKLKSLALQFTSNIVQQCNSASLVRVAAVILNGILKLISEEEAVHKPMAYTIVGQLGQRIPALINKDFSLLEKFFNTLAATDGDLRHTVRNALISMSSAFKLTKEDEIAMMNALLSSHIESPESHVRFVAVHYASTVFPEDDAASRYLLLLACGDTTQEVSLEALKALYGTAYKNERDKQNKEIPLPEFTKLISYVHLKSQAKINGPNSGKKDSAIKSLPYNNAAFTEIVLYLRLCLAKSANISAQGEQIQHPCEYSPLVGRYLETLLKEQPEILNNYLSFLNIRIGHAKDADEVSLSALLEVLGTMSPEISKRYERELPWFRKLMTSTKENIRELSAKIYALIVTHLPFNEFESQAAEIVTSVKNKIVDIQHGALLALSYMMEQKLVSLKHENPAEILKLKVYSTAVEITCACLNENNPLLLTAATQGIGIMGKTFSLPLPDNSDTGFSKMGIVDKLFSTLTSPKMNTKMKETAALSLGFLCVGEEFPHTKSIAEKLISMAKDTKDVEIHLTLGESLVCCVQGKSSLEGRNAWKVLPSEHQVPYSKESDELLVLVLNKLFQNVREPHPNLRQAVCISLLSLLKHNPDRPYIKENLAIIQNSFMDLLSESNEFVQDAASKGLYLVYNSSGENNRESLVSNLLDQFVHGRRDGIKVTSDTVLFEDNEMGKSPLGGNLSTYREICSLASDLNNPKLMYQFLHLANHNAVWTSKKGAAYGFSAFATLDSAELKKYLPIIVPKLYRYQFDPTPKTQQSMASIWRAIVPSTNKAIEEYHKEILEDLSINLTDSQWRVRKSCCHALAELLRSSAPINLTDKAPELWKQLFRVMDDIHEATRLAAANTAKIFSHYCIRRCDASHGKAGEEVLQAVLPVLIDVGIIHNVSSVRTISLQTVSQLVTAAGSLLKPSLVNLIPALLNATGELDSPGLTYFRNAYCTSQETQEAFDSKRASEAKSHYSTETITKCIPYIDAAILKELMPKVIDIMRSSIGLGIKVACSHFIILTTAHLKTELQQYAGKILTTLLNGLTDRNAAVRKNNANTIGHVVGCAKDSSVEKLLNTLNKWYMEREDDSIRLAIGQTLQSVNNNNQEVVKKYTKIILPLTFFAMHAEKVPGNEPTIEVWTDLWGEISPGTETGIRQNLTPILGILKSALESASWTTKAQAANAVSTVATKLGPSIENSARETLLNILTNGLTGRTWNGKERLLNALASLACNSKEALRKDTKLAEEVVGILYKESKKEALEYRRHALKAFSDVLHELGINRFTQIYNIAQEVLPKLSSKNADDDDDVSMSENSKKVEEKMKLQETIYESLGKAWPSCKETQDKYCLQFVTHCNETLPNSTRVVQVAILTTLNLFVDKLILFKISASENNPQDQETLSTVCETLEKILRQSISISKYTRIRKEALNIILSLAKKLTDTKNTKQLEDIISLFKEFLPELTKDNQPEIRTRVVDIKDMLKI